MLIEAIKQYGKAFKRENWQDLLRITFRIFDELKLPEQHNEVCMVPVWSLLCSLLLTLTCLVCSG